MQWLEKHKSHIYFMPMAIFIGEQIVEDVVNFIDMMAPETSIDANVLYYVQS